MIDHPQTYLLKQIAGYKTNGREVLATLNGKYVTVLSDIMREYAEEAVLDVIKTLKEGNNVRLSSGVIEILQPKKYSAVYKEKS